MARSQCATASSVRSAASAARPRSSSDARLQLPHLERLARCGVEPLQGAVGAPVLLLLDQQPDVGERREEREQVRALRLDRGPDLLEQAELGEEVRARRERGRREPAAREDAERREGARGPESERKRARCSRTRSSPGTSPFSRRSAAIPSSSSVRRCSSDVRDGLAHAAVPGQYSPLGPERLRRAEGREPGEGRLPEPAGHVRRRRQVRAVPPRGPRLPVREHGDRVRGRRHGKPALLDRAPPLVRTPAGRRLGQRLERVVEGEVVEVPVLEEEEVDERPPHGVAQVLRGRGGLARIARPLRGRLINLVVPRTRLDPEHVVGRRVPLKWILLHCTAPPSPAQGRAPRGDRPVAVE